MKPSYVLLAAGLLLGAAASTAQTPTVVLHTVFTVHDGDTLRTREDGAVRVSGIDAPEIGYLAKCPAEQALAVQARDYLRARTSAGVDLRRRPGERDREKYGRLLREVYAPDGGNVGQELVQRGLAVAYNGRGARKDWCRP